MTLFDPSIVAMSDASCAPVGTTRRCDWCGGPIPPEARCDSITCSQRCRQARHRFKRCALARPATDQPLTFCYADPPYPGKASYYTEHPDFAGEVDHGRLVEQLHDGYPDGWALSTSSTALQSVLAVCPRTVRVSAWVRGERPTKHNSPLSAWEPVIFHGGRALPSPVDERRVDALVYHSRPRLTDPLRVIGAKPAAFCYWLFDLLGALPGDEFIDLFPGSGGVARAWRYYSSPDDASRRAAAEHDTSRLSKNERAPVTEYSPDVFDLLRRGLHVDA